LVNFCVFFSITFLVSASKLSQCGDASEFCFEGSNYWESLDADTKNVMEKKTQKLTKT
jgi:hypothetical protein